MWQERFRRYVLASDLESEPEFRTEVLRLSHIGLQVIGAIEVVVTLFMVAANMLLNPNTDLAQPRLLMGVLVIGTGAATIAAARSPSLHRYGRVLACFSAVTTAAVTTWFMLSMTRFDRSTDDAIPGNISLILLITVAAIPLRPVQTLWMGIVMEMIYLSMAFLLQEMWGIGGGVNPVFAIFIFILTGLAGALSAVVYDQRRSTWEWHTRTLAAAENLRLSESRNLLAQNAASVGRLAAAISHELNSPIGALVSGVDTLLLLASRQATSGGTDQQRMVVLQAELRKSIHASTERLKEIVARMQRFTNLDKAEVQAANLNELLNDVTALLEPNYEGRPKIELDLQPVPELVCRPQQLSAVFSSLLGNAMDASDGNGIVRVATRHADRNLCVRIEDSGRGLSPDQVENIFDPSFRVVNGRVATGNWSMFSSRQIIREHGGDISINSSPGEGTTIHVTLPLETQLLT